MSKTVHIVQKMSPGGIESVVLDLALMDTAVSVCSLEGTPEGLIAAWPPLAKIRGRLFALSKKQGIRPSTVARVAKVLRKLRPDAVVTHHIGPLVYAGLASRMICVPRTVHVEHDAWHYRDPKRQRLAKLVEYFVQPRRVAVSSVVADQVASALGHVGQILIPNGVDLGRFAKGNRAKARRTFSLPDDVKLIGSVGRLEPVKGHDQLIEALAQLPQQYHLAIGGTGSNADALIDLACQLGVWQRVHLVGHVDAPEKLYPAFDVFCLPSRAEGFPRALIEAQAAELRVVAFDVGGVREATCPRTGTLVAEGNIKALAQALAQSMSQPPCVSPRRFVEPQFSNQRMAERYRAVASL